MRAPSSRMRGGGSCSSRGGGLCRIGDRRCADGQPLPSTSSCVHALHLHALAAAEEVTDSAYGGRGCGRR